VSFFANAFIRLVLKGSLWMMIEKTQTNLM